VRCSAAFSSEGRLAEEAALLADCSDVHEELTRLEVHAREMRRILENGDQSASHWIFYFKK
jgi:uncharacterized protein YicC (UPF0701 family)